LPKTSVVDRFDEFWKTYPRREAKQAAIKAWAKAVQSTDPETIIEGARRYADDPNREPEFTAHPTTWLNQGRWEDAPLPIRRRPAQEPDRLTEAARIVAERRARRATAGEITRG
jgi:hypothetical protein